MGVLGPRQLGKSCRRGWFFGGLGKLGKLMEKTLRRLTPCSCFCCSTILSWSGSGVLGSGLEVMPEVSNMLLRRLGWRLLGLLVGV